jgi:hypothetical protein
VCGQLLIRSILKAKPGHNGNHKVIEKEVLAPH